jgi:hypothetical protein
MEKFTEIYKNWLAQRSEAAKASLPADQRTALAVLDNIKKRAWNSLPEPRRRKIVGELISQGVLPEAVGQCMDIFDARVVGI